MPTVIATCAGSRFSWVFAATSCGDRQNAVGEDGRPHGLPRHSSGPGGLHPLSALSGRRVDAAVSSSARPGAGGRRSSRRRRSFLRPADARESRQGRPGFQRDVWVSSMSGRSSAGIDRSPYSGSLGLYSTSRSGCVGGDGLATSRSPGKRARSPRLAGALCFRRCSTLLLFVARRPEQLLSRRSRSRPAAAARPFIRTSPQPVAAHPAGPLCNRIVATSTLHASSAEMALLGTMAFPAALRQAAGGIARRRRAHPTPFLLSLVVCSSSQPAVLRFGSRPWCSS